MSAFIYGERWEFGLDGDGLPKITCGNSVVFDKETPFSIEDLQRIVECMNGARRVRHPEAIGEAVDVLNEIHRGCPAAPGRWLYDHEMADKAREALSKLRGEKVEPRK